jgi:hypothetical protein
VESQLEIALEVGACAFGERGPGDADGVEAEPEGLVAD